MYPFGSNFAPPSGHSEYPGNPDSKRALATMASYIGCQKQANFSLISYRIQTDPLPN